MATTQGPKEVQKPTDLMKAAAVVKLWCGHQFHFSCAGRWLESNDSCPICREQNPRFTSIDEHGEAVRQRLAELHAQFRQIRDLAFADAFPEFNPAS